jgi:hypothetical protein
MKSKIILLAWALLLAIFLIVPSTKLKAQEANISPSEIKELKEEMLKLINKSRQSEGLKLLELDELASQVGDKHCQEMISEFYFSHWNSQGLKPYIRYSYAGGKDALMENLSLTEGGTYFNSKEKLTNVLTAMHLRMFNEKPPYDGHRQAIIHPQHTHVGVGIAFSESQVRLAQEFIARYVEIKTFASKAKPGDTVNIVGQILKSKIYELAGISIFYEPIPANLTRDELNSRGSYSFPTEEKILRPKLLNQYTYKDGSTGEVNYQKSSGEFSSQFSFEKNKTGIYTIVVWLKEELNKFPVTNICVEVK